jgi:ABC-2 type transport system ATP-binding protein
VTGTVAPAAAVAVSCRGLTKRFGGPDGGVLALDAVDLEVPAGSIFGLLGPNGAGKTTTLRLISGLARPTSGSVTIGGRAVTADDPTTRRDIGVLDQAPRFYGWMRGRELVEFAAALSGLGRVDARRRASGSWVRSAWGTPAAGASAATRAGCANGWGSRRHSSPSRGC